MERVQLRETVLRQKTEIDALATMHQEELDSMLAAHQTELRVVNKQMEAVKAELLDTQDKLTDAQVR